MGTERAIDADVFTMLAKPGDLFLLCSDGLTDMLPADEDRGDDRSPPGAIPKPPRRALVAAANAQGGEDNITVVLFELVEGEAEPEPEPEQEPAPEAGGREP